MHYGCYFCSSTACFTCKNWYVMAYPSPSLNQLVKNSIQNATKLAFSAQNGKFSGDRLFCGGVQPPPRCGGVATPCPLDPRAILTTCAPAPAWHSTLKSLPQLDKNRKTLDKDKLTAEQLQQIDHKLLSRLGSHTHYV